LITTILITLGAKLIWEYPNLLTRTSHGKLFGTA